MINQTKAVADMPELTHGAETVYNCPVCSGKLRAFKGHKLDPNTGMTVYCPHKACPAQEVMGYGANVAAAYKIVCDRFNFASK